MCVRLETYENAESDELVRRMLGGRLANTAFAVLDPTGEEKLTRGGRSPGMSLSSDRGPSDESGHENEEILEKLAAITERYESKGKASDAVLQDFHSLRQALNVASADQRLLVVVRPDEKKREQATKTLQAVFADEDVIGRFHLDTLDAKTDTKWSEVVEDAPEEPGLFVIRSNQFGLAGKVVAKLALDAKPAAVKKALLAANETFAAEEKRKHYEEHVRAGRRAGIEFENEVSRDGASDQPDRRRRRRE